MNGTLEFGFDEPMTFRISSGKVGSQGLCTVAKRQLSQQVTCARADRSVSSPGEVEGPVVNGPVVNRVVLAFVEEPTLPVTAILMDSASLLLDCQVESAPVAVRGEGTSHAPPPTQGASRAHHRLAVYGGDDSPY